MTVRILVVDDHPAVRHGLRTLLGGRPEWEIVDEPKTELRPWIRPVD
jgi:DNA-binding NarL/FixJ family response regulator